MTEQMNLTTMETDMTNATAPVETTEISPAESFVPSEGQDQMLAMIERASRDPNVDAAKFASLMELANTQQDRQRKIAQEDERALAERIFRSAFVAAKERMPQIVKDAHNKQTSSNYARMETVDAKITPIMSEFGFGISFKSGDQPIDGDHMHGIAELIHRDGHVEVYEDRRIPIAGVGIKGTRMMTKTHGYGATKTYARRYMTFDIWGLSVMEKDSDGNANNGLGQTALNCLEQIEQQHTVVDLDLIHASIMAADLKGTDRAKVIMTFTERRKALLNKEERQNASS